MNTYITQIKAICPHTGEMKTYSGPEVPGICFQDAQHYCDTNGLGYCEVIGLLVEEIEVKEGTNEPDWNTRIDFEYVLN